FVAVVVLTWHGYWMQQHARAVKGEVQRRIDEAQASHRLWIVGVLAFTGVFREGAETVLFLWGLMTQAASPSGWTSAAGAFLGPRGGQLPVLPARRRSAPVRTPAFEAAVA